MSKNSHREQPRCKFLIREPDALTYQRLIWPARSLASTGRATVELVAEPDPAYMSETDVLFLRGHVDRHEYALLTAAREAGVKTVLDVCGWIDAPPYDPRYFALQNLRPYSELALSLADRVTSENSRLAEVIRPYTERVSVRPTAIAAVGVDRANRTEIRRSAGIPDDSVVICWPGQVGDMHSLRMIAASLERLLCERLDLWFMSFCDVSDSMFVPEERRISCEYLPYLQYLSKLDAADVLLMPLEPSLHNRLRGLSARHDVLLKGLCGAVSSFEADAEPWDSRLRLVRSTDPDVWINEIEDLIEVARQGPSLVRAKSPYAPATPLLELLDGGL